MKHTESKLQQACIRWFDVTHGKAFNKESTKKVQHRNGTFSFTAHKTSLLYAIPNGGNRDLTTAKVLKSEGVRPGVADLFLSVPRSGYHGLYIELKTDKGKQSDAQKAFEELATENGFVYITIRTVDQFIETVTNYLKS